MDKDIAEIYLGEKIKVVYSDGSEAAYPYDNCPSNVRQVIKRFAKSVGLVG